MKEIKEAPTETRQGLTNYLITIADNVKMHPKATVALRQAAMIITGVTDAEFVSIMQKLVGDTE